MKKAISRRAVLKGMSALGAVGASSVAQASLRDKSLKHFTSSNMAGPVSLKAWDAIVVGAGVFGVWTATYLQRMGKRVLLVDGAGPANARASSGGETRMTRSAYGADAIYSEMSARSLPEWKSLSAKAVLPLFHETGVLFFFQHMADYAEQSIKTHQNLGMPLKVFDRDVLRKQFPQFDFADVEFGLYEPDFGALMARRSVQHLVAGFVEKGGTYRQAAATAPLEGSAGHSLVVDGETMQADALVYACGPWLPKIFPALLAERLFVTRQEVAFVAPPTGDSAFTAPALPGWADFNDGDLYYGFPDIEGRGFKIAHDTHGVAFDPDTGNRRVGQAGYDTLRAYIERRFPALADQPFVGERVCQYTNSSNGDFLIDKHPHFESVYMVGGGSGHGFKHGPEVGRMVSEMVLKTGQAPHARFSLATKGNTHNRTVV